MANTLYWRGGVVPVSVEAGRKQVDALQFLLGGLRPRRIPASIKSRLQFKPSAVVVLPINWAMTSWLTRGWPRKFWVMWHEEIHPFDFAQGKRIAQIASQKSPASFRDFLSDASVAGSRGILGTNRTRKRTQPAQR